MHEIPREEIKDLRGMTGAGWLDCKKVLVEFNGNLQKASDALRSRGLVRAAKRARAVSKGRIFSYIHAEGNMGALLQLNCETDFVARNDDFLSLGKVLCVRVAVYDPPDIGSLAEQFKDVIGECAARFGENIEIARFERYEI